MRIPGFGHIMSDSTYAKVLEANNQLDQRILNRLLEDFEWEPINDKRPKIISDVSTKQRLKNVQRAIHYWHNDPMIGDAVDLYTYYVFGRGMPAPRAYNSDLQTVLDEFWNDEDNKLVITSTEAQIQKCNELQLQGDIFFVLFCDEGTGAVLLSDIPVDEIDDIIQHPSNRKRHLFYKRIHYRMEYDFQQNKWKDQTDQKPEISYYADWEKWTDEEANDQTIPRPSKIEEGKVFHVSINRLSDGKFGSPKVTRSLNWARAHNEFMTARVALMQAAAWLAWRRQVTGDASKVQKMSSVFAGDVRGTAGIDGEVTSGAPIPSPPRYAGVLTENENSKMEFVRTDTGSSNAKADGQMLKGMVATGAGFPIHYFGETDTNLATATSLELPVLKMCEAGQEQWEGTVRSMIDYVIREKIRAGKLPKPKVGKFSDVDQTVANDIAEGKIQEADNLAPEFKSALADAGIVDVPDISGDVLYSYQLSLPNILQRQLTETINSVVNVLTSFDPQGNNDELARWALDFCLQTFGVSNSAQVVERIYPKGVPIDRGPVATKGRLVKSTGEQYKSTQDKTGAPTQARTPEENAAAAQEAGVSPSPTLEEIKREFMNMYEECHAEIEKDLLAAIGGNDNGKVS